jgi:hypothetical protein
MLVSSRMKILKAVFTIEIGHELELKNCSIELALDPTSIYRHLHVCLNVFQKRELSGTYM